MFKFSYNLDQGKDNQSLRFIDKENILQTNIKLFWMNHSV